MADLLTMPESTSPLPNSCLNGDGTEHDSVMDIKGDIRNAFTDARAKINHLRIELKEKDESLAKEKYLREKAEKELTTLSLTGISNGRHSHEESPIPTPNSFTSNQTNGFGTSGYASLNRRDELAMTKQLNKKLTEQVANLEQEVAVLLSKQENDLAGIEAKVTARGAALIDRIYSAQKSRDSAVMNRLKLANEERDDCLQRIAELEEELGHAQKKQKENKDDREDVYVNYNELSILDILHHIQKLNNRKSLEEPTRVIEERLKQSIKAMKSQSMNEVKQLMRERDEAIAKVRILEKEIEMMTNDNQQRFVQQHEEDAARLKASQTQLLICQQEKEEVEKRAAVLQEELKTLRVHYSLQKSLKADQTLRDQFNSTINNFESKLKQRDSELQLAQQTYDDVVVKLNHTIREKNVMAKQLQETIIELKSQKENSNKLERLVSVLRKRIKQSD